MYNPDMKPMHKVSGLLGEGGQGVHVSPPWQRKEVSLVCVARSYLP